MTIQEMINLLIHTFEAVSRSVDDILATSSTGAIPDGFIERQIRLAELEEQKNRYLPFFSPMNCEHCIHKSCNRKREKGVCDEYEVKL